MKMNNNHVYRFLKRNKLKPLKLNYNSPEFSKTSSYKKSSVDRGKTLYRPYFIQIKNMNTYCYKNKNKITKVNFFLLK